MNANSAGPARPRAAGKVLLVGAGPGDPELLTLRGRRALESADLVLYDYLVDPQTLVWRRPDAELVCLGSHADQGTRDPGRSASGPNQPSTSPTNANLPSPNQSDALPSGALPSGANQSAQTESGSGPVPSAKRASAGRLLSQDEIHRRMIAGAREGKRVVRLKGGDAALFGRLAEEIAALEQAGVEYEVVPGVTAASAASAATGIPLTHREFASGVAFIAGQQADVLDAARLDYSALARFPGTLVFYMGVTSAATWSAELLRHGKSPATPVAVVRHASLPRQQTLLTTLADVASLLAPGKVRPPAVIFVGEAVKARAAYDWFSQRPLFGQTVLATRPAHQLDALTQRLTDMGACVLCQPAITIGPPADWAPLDAALDRLDAVDWVVFSSANGVDAVCQRLATRGQDLRALGGVRLAAIGSATAGALAHRGLRADLTPTEFRAEALAAALGPTARGQRFLLIRASRGRETLAETLTEAGGDVRQVVAYESRDTTFPDPAVAAALADGKIDWITVTSSAIARSLVAMFGADLARARLAAISPLTASTLAELGHPAHVVAADYDIEGVLAAMVRFVEETRAGEGIPQAERFLQR